MGYNWSKLIINIAEDWKKNKVVWWRKGSWDRWDYEADQQVGMEILCVGQYSGEWGDSATEPDQDCPPSATEPDQDWPTREAPPHCFDPTQCPW